MTCTVIVRYGDTCLSCILSPVLSAIFTLSLKFVTLLFVIVTFLIFSIGFRRICLPPQVYQSLLAGWWLGFTCDKLFWSQDEFNLFGILQKYEIQFHLSLFLYDFGNSFHLLRRTIFRILDIIFAALEARAGWSWLSVRWREEIASELMFWISGYFDVEIPIYAKIETIIEGVI